MKKYQVLKQQAADLVSRHYDAFRLGGVSGLTTAIVMTPTMVAFAEEPVSGSNLLTGEVWTAITAGFSDMAVTCTQILAIASVTGISIVGMTAAAKYAMKKIRGVLNAAA